MILGSYTLKVQGGKLVRAKVELAGKKIRNLIITGDFFAYPEDLIELIEKNLEGFEADYTNIRETIENIVKLEKATLIGVKPEDIAEVIMKATTEN